MISNVTADASGAVSIVDNANNVTINTQITSLLVSSPEKAIIIQDKNGDQYVVEKDGANTKITKVEGGGLSPSSSVAVSDEVLDIIKKALKELRKDYGDSKIATLKTDMVAKSIVWNAELQKQDTQLGLSGTTGSAEEESQSVFFDFKITDEVPQSNAIGRQYKDLEFEYNKAILIQLIAEDFKQEQARKDMAVSLTYNGVNIQVYIDEQRKLNKKDEEIIPVIKSVITDFIGMQLKKYFVLKR